MKSIITLCLVVVLTTILGSCDKYDHEPILNAGYDSNVLLPEPEGMTDADYLHNKDIKDEYNK